MTPRSLPEWIGKHPDQKVPDRVKLRIFEREGIKRPSRLQGRPFPKAEPQRTASRPFRRKEEIDG